MYNKGELRQVPIGCVINGEYYCATHNTEWDCHANRDVVDSRTDDGLREGHAYLPHSCDEWVIGGEKQIEALIADLQRALSQIKTKA